MEMMVGMDMEGDKLGSTNRFAALDQGSPEGLEAVLNDDTGVCEGKGGRERGGERGQEPGMKVPAHGTSDPTRCKVTV